MAVSESQIAQLRRMVAEPDETTYEDDAIIAMIEAHPIIDANGVEPYTPSVGGVAVNGLWVPTYDLNAAAADIWDEKASAVADRFDVTDVGGSYSRSQVAEQYAARARYFRSRRSPRTTTVFRMASVVGTVETN